MTTVLWLRRDLRRGDHPALVAAAESGPVLPLYVIDPQLWDAAGPVRRGWLAASLLAAAEAYDGRLCVRRGDPADVVPAVAAEVGAGAVHVTAETTPRGARRDRRVRARLERSGAELVETGTPYAVGPGVIRTLKGGPYQVFTPFARAWQARGWSTPAPGPRVLRLVEHPSQPAVVRGLRLARDECPVPLPPAGEEAALSRWRTFQHEALAPYDELRDRPDVDGTSRLSAYLKVGAIHPRTVLRDLAHVGGPGAQRLRTELAWREFYADVLWHRPESAWHDLRPELANLDYESSGEAGAHARAWCEGRTGYPFVDAGMRQLLASGWMHNRVRMVVASFYTKDLHLWWPSGARYFLAHLIDADVASNSHGWQWVAGTGTDAAPYFRVFNPVAQGRRFDPVGDYVRSWVPELRHLPGSAVHEPWRHPDGYADGYPEPIIDHAVERRAALDRYRCARTP